MSVADLKEPQHTETIAKAASNRRLRGKSELRRAVSRVTPGQRKLTEQWHRKYTASAAGQLVIGVRVKWWGKSPPRSS